jgi:hypothetical protein
MSAFDPKQTLPRAPSSPSKKLSLRKRYEGSYSVNLLIDPAVSTLKDGCAETIRTPEEGGVADDI